MSDLAIDVRSIGKRYQLGAEKAGYRTLREAFLARARNFFRRRENVDAEEFWALRDVSFQVKRGEVIGIIGRNGAGKSTLLKLLSRITEPTEGEADINGRVGSLLEVGTGFHPELSGRENIYLNGAILGMTRAEISRKFEEIVAFAEVERFLDTPVKRYSSGMYMRLAFAVAAHLEPEILIVDEVLAVGDTQFQKKCLGKMGDVAKEGRTVLFVSHNMQAVGQLTKRAIVLQQRVVFDGPTELGILHYNFNATNQSTDHKFISTSKTHSSAKINSAIVTTSGLNGEQLSRNPMSFTFDISINTKIESLCFSFQIFNEADTPVCHFWLFDKCKELSQPGKYKLECAIPDCRLYMGKYYITAYLSDRRSNVMIETVDRICRFEVSMRGVYREQYDWSPTDMVYLEDFYWTTSQLIG